MKQFFKELIQGLFDFLKTVSPIITIAACVLGMMVIIYKCLKLDNRKAAIAISTILCCVLMIPIANSFDKLIDINMINQKVDELDHITRETRIKNQEIQIDELNIELENNRLSIEERIVEIQAINETIRTLENANLSVRNFSQIFEVALLQADVKQTTVRKDILNKGNTGWGITADYYFDEVLIVISHDIEAKFGIDLKTINILKTNENSIVISGITPTFIGTSKNIPQRHIAETRRINQKDISGERVTTSISINNTQQGKRLAEDRARHHSNQFQERLNNGIELGFMDDAVIQLAQNFLKYLFSPYYANIEFSTRNINGSVPFLEYFETETNTLNAQAKNLHLENLDMIQKNTKLENDIYELTQELNYIASEN